MSVQINLYRAGGLSGHGFQLAIEEVDEHGNGHGYRIFGPKFIDDSVPLVSHTVSERDAKEISDYLAAAAVGEEGT